MNTVADRDLALPPLLGQAEDEREAIDLVRYARAIGRNKWRILALVLAVGILAVLVANSLPPVYRGMATMLVEASKPKIVSIEEVYSSMTGTQREYYQTQMEILRSRELAAKLVRRLKLAEHPLYDPAQRAPAFYEKWLPAGFLGGTKPAQPPSAEQIERGVIGAVQSALGVQLVRNSQLMRISFESGDPELAAAVPNALAEIFIEADLEARMKMTQQATVFLTGQTAELKKKVAEAEQALQAYRDREKIIDTKSLSQSGATRQVEELTTSLIEARRRRSEAEYAYQQVSALTQGKTENLENLPAIQKLPQVLRLREVEAEAERRYADAAKRYGAEHPRMVAAEIDLRTARENTRRGLAGAVQTVAREYESARANEAAIERTLATAKGDIQSLNRKEFQLAALEREVTTSRQMYDMFLQRIKETNISGEIHSAIARVIDPAIVPGGPSGPNKRLIVGLALFAAIVAGVLLALLIERLDNTVKTSHEVEQKLGVPTLGVLNITRVKGGQRLERIFLEDPQTSFSEAIRTVRSGVMLAGIDAPRKVVLVTSSVPEEGKTTVASNLAFALGQVKKTLLIDADMRRPKIGRLLGGAQSNLAGLSQMVTGEAPIERCIYPVQGAQLHVLPAGKVPPNPLELLASHRFGEAMERLAAAFEIIVIDSPPVQLVSDALVLSRHATEVVYVVKADDTPYPLARRGILRLRRVSAPIVGVVLNLLDAVKADRYYGEYGGYAKRYYSKKYGYGYTPKA